MRAEFEKHFPMPHGVEWREGGAGFIPQYVVVDHRHPPAFDNCNRQNARWEGWRAARQLEGGQVIISRTLTPDAWKRLIAADVWPVTPQSCQRMLDVLAEEAEREAVVQPALRKALVLAAIPLTAMRMAGTVSLHCPRLQQQIHEAIAGIESVLVVQGGKQ